MRPRWFRGLGPGEEVDWGGGEWGTGWGGGEWEVGWDGGLFGGGGGGGSDGGGGGEIIEDAMRA